MTSCGGGYACAGDVIIAERDERNTVHLKAILGSNGHPGPVITIMLQGEGGALFHYPLSPHK